MTKPRIKLCVLRPNLAYEDTMANLYRRWSIRSPWNLQCTKKSVSSSKYENFEKIPWKSTNWRIFWGVAWLHQTKSSHSPTHLKIQIQIKFKFCYWLFIIIIISIIWDTLIVNCLRPEEDTDYFRTRNSGCYEPFILGFAFHSSLFQEN